MGTENFKMVAITEELSNQRKTGIKGRRTGGNQRQDKKSDGNWTTILFKISIKCCFLLETVCSKTRTISFLSLMKYLCPMRLQEEHSSRFPTELNELEQYSRKGSLEIHEILELA